MKLRDKYGVVQDKAVTKYVTLVGTVLAQSSSRPNLPWTFVVLDTDGVNAFAAPGGYVHITRGALALIQNEAELADVLGHEISHVTEKHTINAIQESERRERRRAAATRQDFLQNVADRGYSDPARERLRPQSREGRGQARRRRSPTKRATRRRGSARFSRGSTIATKISTSRAACSRRIRETQDRLDTLTKIIASEKLTAPAPRRGALHDVDHLQADSRERGAAGRGGVPGGAADKPGGSKFGLGGLNSLGKEKSSNQTISSAGSRGVNPDRDAKGGPIKTIVVVTVTAAEVDEFKKGITG